MTPRGGSIGEPQAQSEALQPSLWDRLVNDLPGLDAEISSLRRGLAKDLGGADKLDELLEHGVSASADDKLLDDDTKKRLFQLTQKQDRRRAIQASGIMVTREVLREAVRRDIEMLFNVERMEAEPMMTDREANRYQTAKDLLVDYPQVQTSVLNYGVPSFAGRTSTDFDKSTLRRELKQTLIHFEPRLKPDSIRINIRQSEKIGMRIDVDATLMLSPTPERLRLSTTIDLDSGSAATVLEDR
ncbi:type VI secretion system baseplate subunit TssE [uncultured Tateyamaria sp.]|uniref:type VI secretion system baseplate subunit TssE n=1 Tax=uncultured Tateyamaria sp. TaxID=455651 RepID=UPI002632FBB2|nr:type VI secretion system baseplate subunit TssE [uncultured Tateyamaria sp.]